jgi:hypothetical protein
MINMSITVKGNISPKKLISKIPIAHLFKNFTLSLSLSLLLCSCTSFRGLPDHGGGKRFDEEQRMISSSIKATIGEINFSVLKGKKVKLIIDGMETSGGGRSSWSGFKHFNPSMNIREAGPGTEFTSQNLPMGYTIDSSYTANNNLTSRDMKYLEFILKMRCYMEGVRLVPNGQDVDLLIAVDVLGTNRSRDDHLLFVRDHLHASTEITYCCVNAKTREPILGISSVGSQARYSENWIRLTNLKGHQRELEKGLQAPYKIKGEELILASAQPRRVQTEAQQDVSVKKSSVLKLEILPDEPTISSDQAIEKEKLQIPSGEELYRQGLEAAKRKDKATLQQIIDTLKAKHPKSEFIEVLQNKLSSLEIASKNTPVALAQSTKK